MGVGRKTVPRGEFRVKSEVKGAMCVGRRELKHLGYAKMKLKSHQFYGSTTSELLLLLAVWL
jgi:hypothetical protein